MKQMIRVKDGQSKRASNARISVEKASQALNRTSNELLTVILLPGNGLTSSQEVALLKTTSVN